MERVVRELERRSNNPDEGWDERDALKHWAQICGPSAITRYLHAFLLNEIKLRPGSELTAWQGRLSKLFSYVLRHGMPMEQLAIAPFREAMFQSRNAEEALLVGLNACAQTAGKISVIEHPEPTAFSTWFKRIQGQRTGYESSIAASCMSYLNLSGVTLHLADFYNANLQAGDFHQLQAQVANFGHSDLRSVDLQAASLWEAYLERANLEGANLQGANLERANLESANLQRANLEGADLERANLQEAKLQRANLQGANLERANLEEADLQGANLPPGFHKLAERSKGKPNGGTRDSSV